MCFQSCALCVSRDHPLTIPTNFLAGRLYCLSQSCSKYKLNSQHVPTHTFTRAQPMSGSSKNSLIVLAPLSRQKTTHTLDETRAQTSEANKKICPINRRSDTLSVWKSLSKDLCANDTFQSRQRRVIKKRFRKRKKKKTITHLPANSTHPQYDYAPVLNEDTIAQTINDLEWEGQTT